MIVVLESLQKVQLNAENPLQPQTDFLDILTV